MTEKLRKALHILKDGGVSILQDDPDLTVVQVRNPRGGEYFVTFYEDNVRCECPDYQYRNDPSGSYLCKHCYAALQHLIHTTMEGDGK